MPETLPPPRPSCPLFIDLTGRLCVIVGGGALAARRAQSLLEGGASLRVIAPEISPAVETLVSKGEPVELIRRAFADGDLEGAFLVVAATGVEAVDAAVAEEAVRRGCLLNSAADGSLGDTTVPAVVRRGRLEIAVGTSGASPKLAGRIRREIEESYGAEWTAYLDLLAATRALARKRVPDAPRRRELLDRATTPEIAEMILASGVNDPHVLLGMLESDEPQAAASRVALVGAGPGDPGLITTKGLARLRAADVVIYDYLVDAELVAQAPAHAERIYVGKRGGHDYMKQPRITELLIAKAQEAPGRLVVRLKGGDPYVFGRGGEEALALVEAGIPFEVVPGISAGSAVPAAAGIPVTHRGLSAAVTFVTGHEDPAKPHADVDWEALGKASGTICVFMGVHNAEKIAHGLLGAGRPVSEPVAVIRWGTTPEQETLLTTLGELAADIQRHGIEAPAMMVVGSVVGLAQQLGDDGVA